MDGAVSTLLASFVVSTVEGAGEMFTGGAVNSSEDPESSEKRSEEERGGRIFCA